MVVEGFFNVVALMLIGYYMLKAVIDISSGEWHGHLIMMGVILFGYGALQAKSNQPHGSGLMIAGVVVVIGTWIFAIIRSKR